MATKDFLPPTWSAFAGWYQNFALHLLELAEKYSITDTVKTSVSNDNNWLQYWVAAKFTARQQEKQLTDYTDAIANNDIGSTAPAVPTWSLPPDPPAEVLPGLRKRVRQIANQIKASANYAESDGALLGIVGTSGEEKPADERKAVFTAHTLANYAVAIEFKKQGADAMHFETRKTGESRWNTAGTKTASPAKFTFNFDAPAQIEIRSILVKKDEPIGEYSDIVTVTIAP